MMWCRTLALLLLVLAGCAAPADIASRPVAMDVLSDFEDARHIPPQVARLPLPPGRAFVILVQLPAPGVVDLGDPQAARRGLLRFLDPVAVWQAGTRLGHAMVGWRCADGSMGLVSKTGDEDDRGFVLLRQGWGLGAALATYDDGRLVTPAQIPQRQRRVLASGRARILAEEIPAQNCTALRAALQAYLAQPAEVQARYGMVSEPAAPLGTGCGGFAVWLAAQGGAFSGPHRAMTRDLILRDAFIGRGSAPPAGVTPPDPGPAPALSPLRLVRGDWSAGDAVGQIRLFDMEFLLHALDRADPARMPRLPEVPQALDTAIDGWLARSPYRVPVRIGAARAVLLLDAPL